MNLAPQLQARLPASTWRFLRHLGAFGAQEGFHLYLVGGAVRDLLLQRPLGEVDLVVEGNAVALAAKLGRHLGASLRRHPRFGTAKIFAEQGIMDIATARSEVYPSPGALPTVTPGTIVADLARRDFAINAMALSLHPDSFGQLCDPCHGLGDLQRKSLRVLHERSFRDDPTRVFRAVRYEQRLGFVLEPHTEGLLRRDARYLETITGERLFHEIQRILQEERPEKAIRRLGELGILSVIHPSLRAGPWLVRRYRAARRRWPEGELPPLYLGLLLFPLTPSDREAVLARLRLQGRAAAPFKALGSLRMLLAGWRRTAPRPRDVVSALKAYPEETLKIALLSTSSLFGAQALEHYLQRWRFVKPALDGTVLRSLGVPEGPHIGRLLALLTRLRLEGQVTTEEEERVLVRQWLRKRSLTPASDGPPSSSRQG